MQIPVKVEIRSAYQLEHVHIDARSKGGESVPAIDFDKRFYRAEFEGEGCLLRFDRNSVAVETWKRGDIVEVLVTAFSVNGDVGNLTISGGKVLK